MKNLSKILFVLLTLLSASIFGQKTVFDIVNNSSKVVFAGIDFRYAKFIGTSGFTEPSKIQNIYLQEWNSFYLKEYEKYSFAEELKLLPENYAVNITNMITLNESVVVKDIITNEMDYELPEDQLQGIVNDYELKLTDGIGVAYIVETFNSFEDKATVYVVFFDLNNKSIFFKQKVVAAPGGLGVKNFWARAFYNLQADYFPKWYKDWKKQAKKNK